MAGNIRRRQLLVALIPAFLIGLVAISSKSSIDAELHLKSIKSRLPFLATGALIYRRELRYRSQNQEQVSAAFQTLMELESSELDITELVSLTNDAAPDIRSLALLSLVAQESRELIPACIKLVNDDARTLPALQSPPSVPLFPGRTVQPDISVPTRPQMVGNIARTILGIFEYPLSYTDRSTNGGLQRIDSSKIDTWWAARQDNQDWLGWYEFLFLRATHGTSPIPKSSGPRIVQIRELIDELPRVTRNWLMLYLSNSLSRHSESENYATEDEILEAARELGPDRLIAFLKDGRRDGLRSPKLDNSQNGRRFIIGHAGELFAKEHASSLMELNLFTAAADADPTIVRIVVDEGLLHFTAKYQTNERGRLMAALAVHGNDADREKAVTWFYQQPNVDRGSSSGRGPFLATILRRRPNNWRKIVQPLVAHKDFEHMHPSDVLDLSRLVQDVANVSWVHRRDNVNDHEERKNKLRELFGIPGADSKYLATPKNVLQEPVWSMNLQSQTQPHSLAVSDDGKLLAVGMVESAPALEVFNAENGQLMHRFHVPTGGYFRAEFINDQKLLFGTTVETESDQLMTWTVGEETYRPLNIEADLQLNGQLPLLDPRMPAWLRNSETAWRFHKRSKRHRPLEVSPDARLIAIRVSKQPLIELIGTRDGHVKHVLKGLSAPATNICFSSDSKFLIGHGSDCRLIIWDTESGEVARRYYSHSGTLRFSNDGKSFFAGAEYAKVGCYETATGASLFMFSPHRQGPPTNVLTFLHAMISISLHCRLGTTTVRLALPGNPTFKNGLHPSSLLRTTAKSG